MVKLKLLFQILRLFIFPNSILTTKLIDGSFPDYQKVIQRKPKQINRFKFRLFKSD